MALQVCGVLSKNVVLSVFWHGLSGFVARVSFEIRRGTFGTQLAIY